MKTKTSKTSTSMFLTVLTAALLVALIRPHARAASGDLDTSFDGDGKWIGPTNTLQAAAVAIQSDGKIVAGGYGLTGAGGTDFAVARLSTNGTLDVTFDGDGIVFTDVASASTDELGDLVIQPDGMILGAGKSAFTNLCLIRYQTNGVPDASFGTGGKVIIADVQHVEAIILQPDGRILVGGTKANDFCVWRFTTNGVLDASFGGGSGFVQTDILGAGRSDSVRDLALQSDGKIVAGGGHINSSDTPDFALVRYTTNGVLDTTFGGGDGTVTTDFAGNYDRCYGIAVQSDDRIIATGEVEDSDSASVFGLARYTANGVLDTTFGGGDGLVFTAFSDGDSGAVAYDVVLQGDEKIFVCGEFSNSSGFQFALARYDANGVLDTTFGGGDGLVTTAFPAPSDATAQAVALQADGRIVLAGDFANIVSDIYGFALARYLNAVASPPDLACTVAPAFATNLVGQAHEVTATVLSNNLPVNGATVHFFVSAGPNVGSGGTDATDSNGEAFFQYDGLGAAGTDTIRSTGVVSGISFSATAYKVWIAPTVVACSLDPQAATNLVGEIHTVTSTVTSNGTPVNGVTVDFQITAGPDLGTTATDITDANGEAVFAYTNNGAAGTDTISATGLVSAVSFSCTAAKLWVPPSADLSVLKADAPDPVALGSNLTYTLTIQNSGPLPATGVTVSDTLPNGVSFVSASTGCNPSGNTVTCNLGGLDAGGSTNVTIIVTANATGTITNTVTVSGNESDPDSANNTALAVTTVSPPLPDLTLAIENAVFTCSNTTKGVVCTSAGTLTLANNGSDYGSATLTVTGTKKTKEGKPPKWKIEALLDDILLDLGANPPAFIQVYLSDDAALDPLDTPLLKKPVDTLLLDSLSGQFKAVKLKLKIPKGVDLSGWYLIAVIDHDDVVDESDENNNAAVIGPVP